MVEAERAAEKLLTDEIAERCIELATAAGIEPVLAAVVTLSLGTAVGYSLAGGLVVLSLRIPFSLRMARQWERVVWWTR